jgi:multidrug resistance efflux pump
MMDESHASPPPSTRELIDRLSRFQGPPQAFLTNLLAVQCHLAQASGGAILRAEADNVNVLATWPALEEGQPTPAWLAHAAEALPETFASGETEIRPLHDSVDMYGAPPRRHVVLIPMARPGQAATGAAAFWIETGDIAHIAASREKLELTASLLSLYEMRLTLQARQNDVRRLRESLEVVAATNEQGRFHGLAMAICNDLASRWECHRVSLGFLGGRYVRLAAMSHTEKFSRKMQAVQDVESAMEECVDQDLEITYPSDPSATCVARAAEQLAGHHGPSAVLSVPLRLDGEPVAAITLERPAEAPFAVEEVESLRLALNMITPRLMGVYETDRWFGSRWARRLRRGAGAIVGPKHTWAKLLVLGLIGLVCFATFVKGNDDVQGTFAIQPLEKQYISSQFDGRLAEIRVGQGDTVVAGQVLAVLDTRELAYQRDRVAAQQARYETEADAAFQEGDIGQSHYLDAQANEAAAQVALLEMKIQQASLRATKPGIVVSEDLQRLGGIGRPVARDDRLFEIVAPEAFLVELLIPEDRIADVAIDQRGELASQSYPDQKVSFTVKWISPRAELIDQENVIRVRVEIDSGEIAPWMHLGTEGVARIHVGEKPYGELWTRKLVNWVRMRFWL